MFGIPVSMSFTTLLVAAFIGLSVAPSVGAVGAVFATAAFFVSILAHEFGHALTARRFGVGTSSIRLWALGGVAHLDRRPPRPGAQAAIAVAGPAVSLAIGFFSLALALVVPFDALVWIGVINVILAVFNMFPGTPLDGGHVVEALRWKMTGSRVRAARDAAVAGFVVGSLVSAAGVALIVSGSPAIFTVLVGVFLMVSSRAAARSAVVEGRLDGHTVADVTAFGLASFDVAYDAFDVLDQRRRVGPSGVFVVTENGVPVSVGDVTSLASAESLGQAVSAVGDHDCVDVSDGLVDALVGLRHPGLPVLVSDAGRLVGVMDMSRVAVIADPERAVAPRPIPV